MIIDRLETAAAGVYPRLHEWRRECFQETSVGILSVKGNSFEHLEQKNEST